MQITRRQMPAAGTAAIAAGTLVIRRCARRPRNTIRFGHIVDESGVLKGVAGPSVVSADMAVAKLNAAGGVNGMKVELVRYDPGSDPRQAAIAARKLIEDDKVHAIIGPFSSGEVLVAMNDAERAKITMIPVAALSAQPARRQAIPVAAWSRMKGLQFRRVLNSMKRKGAPDRRARDHLCFRRAGLQQRRDQDLAADPGTSSASSTARRSPSSIRVSIWRLRSPRRSKASRRGGGGRYPGFRRQVVHELHRQGFKGHMTGVAAVRRSQHPRSVRRRWRRHHLRGGILQGLLSAATRGLRQGFLEGCKAKGIQKLGRPFIPTPSPTISSIC